MSTIRFRVSAALSALTMVIVCSLFLAHAETSGAQSVTLPNPLMAADYPSDPSSDFVWSAGFGGVVDVQKAFNRARATENSDLGTFIPPMTLPSQSTWNAMTEGERALWLINQERTARELKPLHGLEKNVTEVAQDWAEWLLANSKFGHEFNGSTPYKRLYAKPAIGACHDPLSVSENIYFIATTSVDGNPIPIEQAVYTWMYDDKAYGWGHRHAMLWTPYADNSGTAGQEGFLGIGHARGSYTNPFNGYRYPDTDLIVMNVFDPCAGWSYGTPPKAPAPPAPAPVVPPPSPGTRSVSGGVTLPTWITIEDQPFEGKWTGWRISDKNGPADGEYSWVHAKCRKYAGEYSAMAVGGGADGLPTECSDHYPNNADSWAIYGPFSLADAIAAEVQIKAWVYTEPYHDWLCLTASLDRKMFNGPCVSGDSGVSKDHLGWVDEGLDLNKVYRMGSLLGQPKVYIALTFVSDSSGTLPHQGAYVDSLILRKAVISNSVTGAQTTAGEPLPGVVIRDESGHYTMTAKDGSFALKGLPAGKHVLTPSKEGYQFYPPSIQVDLGAGNVANISFVGTTSIHKKIYLPVVVSGR
jgi:uncharacterized protein YkwD